MLLTPQKISFEKSKKYVIDHVIYQEKKHKI